MKLKMLAIAILAVGTLASAFAHGPSLPPDPWVGGGAGAGGCDPNDKSCFPPCSGTQSDPCLANPVVR